MWARSTLAFLVLGSASSEHGCGACAALLFADEEEPAKPTATATPTPAASTAPTPDPVDDPGPPPSPTTRATAPAPSPPNVPPSSAGVDGRYECFQIRVIAGPNFTFKTTFVPGALPGFTIAGGTYTSSGRQGAVSAAGAIVTFAGGSYDGWRGMTATNSTGFYIAFRGASPGNPQPGSSLKSGDYQCYRQKG